MGIFQLLYKIHDIFNEDLLIDILLDVAPDFHVL